MYVVNELEADGEGNRYDLDLEEERLATRLDKDVTTGFRSQ